MRDDVSGDGVTYVFITPTMKMMWRLWDDAVRGIWEFIMIVPGPPYIQIMASFFSWLVMHSSMLRDSSGKQSADSGLMQWLGEADGEGYAI